MSSSSRLPGSPIRRPDPGVSNQHSDDVEADLPVLRSLKEQDQTRNRIIGLVAGIVAWQIARLVPGLGWACSLFLPFRLGLVPL